MAYLKINNKDFSNIVSGLKVGYETLVSSNSGRNANGDTVIDVINNKNKVYVTFRHTFENEMNELLNAIEDYVVSVTFLNPKTKTQKTITAYIGTPEPELYTTAGRVIYKPMSLNFTEL